MPDCSHLQPSEHAPWHASLRLRFAADGATTRLMERAHSGPLRVQKPLYPEGPRICHAIMVHPPGGVVGGDTLSVSLHAGAGTHAFLTSPGAAKWYRANGRVSRQDVHIEAGPGAIVEWMPQETILFNNAQVRTDQRVELAADASYIGCDMLCFGRRASGERFASGSIGQRLQIRRGGQLVWWEQGLLDAAGPLFDSPLGLHGTTVCATLLGVGRAPAAGLVEAVRKLDPGLAVSQVKSVFVARYLGRDSEHARHLMTRAWQLLRPALVGCDAPIPRIWNT